MADKNWRSNPLIQQARTIAQAETATAVIVLVFRGGTLRAAIRAWNRRAEK